MSDAPPRRRIELIQTLGQGGFGAVYLADVHGRDDFVQRLAVKVLSAEMSAEPDIAARQRDEARLLARLNHDHIVRVVDLTELDGRPAVLMEYVEGVDAGELLRRGPLPVKAALQIAAATASALDAAWSSVGPRTGQPLRVIHRDIKPANLLVSRHGGVKVLDFGIARAEFDREGRTGSVQFGTARFMAPEQWLYGQASHKVDVYALGVSLVELLTGMHMERAPLQEEAFAAHVAAVRRAVGQEDWGPGLRAGIDSLLAAMLSFAPEDRPDAAEVHERLAWLVDQSPGEGLARWARQVVPELLAARLRAQADLPLPSLSPARPAAPAPATAAPDPTRVLTPSQAATAPREGEAAP
ncbi:serine/threonine protein kinase, partial [Myxococcota bacterium]|nr:serine/threonine protein kinase [Myxococcota bacterium]